MKLTLYTPTYNRKGLLERVYHHLLSQTNKDFIWLIIDDGSVDGTEELVSIWQNKENGFPIQYHYKENGGVHTVRDYAYKNCETELIASVDSDDWLVDDAVETILHKWSERHPGDYAGLIAPAKLTDGRVLDDNYPKQYCVTYQELAFVHKFAKDKITILNADVIKKIPDAPSFNGEKLVLESYKWIQIPEDRPFIVIDKPLLVKEYQETGYTNNSYQSIKNNPNSFRELYKAYIKHAKYWRPRISGYVGFITCSLLLHEQFLVPGLNKFLAFLLYPIAYKRYLRMKR